MQIWGCLKDGIRVGVSLLDFFLSTPVVQVPVFMVVGSGATAHLAQVEIKLIVKNWGTTLIFKGINYISLYIFIILIQIIFKHNRIFMSRIRGKKSGILPQRQNWMLSNLDFALLWA